MLERLKTKHSLVPPGTDVIMNVNSEAAISLTETRLLEHYQIGKHSHLDSLMSRSVCAMVSHLAVTSRMTACSETRHSLPAYEYEYTIRYDTIVCI